MSEDELRVAIAEAWADGVSTSCMIGLALFNAMAAQPGVDAEQLTADLLRNLRGFEEAAPEGVRRALKMMTDALDG